MTAPVTFLALAPFRWTVVAMAALLAVVPTRATSVIAPDFDGLVSGADYVVHASVKSVTSEYRSTPQGRAIFTKVELQVLETIAGTPPSPLVLQLLGGTMDGVTMRVDGIPQFQVGDEDILFVQNNGKQFCPLVGIMNGRFPVKHDASGNAYVTRNNGLPLYDPKEVKQDMAATAAAQPSHAGQAPLSASAFASQIRQAAGIKATLSKSPANEN